MIDHEKKRRGPGTFLTVCAIAAAAAVAVGMTVPAGGSGTELSGENTEYAAGESTAAGTTAGSAAGTTAGSAAGTTAESAAGTTAESAAESKLRKDGEYVSGVLEPAGKEEYTSRELLLINPWHLLPEDYEPDLEDVEYGHRMDACAAEHMRDMLSDCREAGCTPLICSSYRDRDKQQILFDSDVRRYMYRGYSEEEAIEETARNVAVPGSSEHEAGLACDIVYLRYQVLDERQEENETQQWLMEHCREYGFILRYPRDKQDITGITYEPWHYRYVGKDAAQEIMSRGICLEEYLGVIDTGAPESGAVAGE